MAYKFVDCSIQPVLLVNPCNMMDEEERFKGTVDVIAINGGSMTYHKDVNHASGDCRNGWVYPDEIDLITQTDMQKNAYIKALRENYDTITAAQRKVVDEHFSKFKELPFN